jgi:hypothetical protein
MELVLQKNHYRPAKILAADGVQGMKREAFVNKKTVVAHLPNPNADPSEYCKKTGKLALYYFVKYKQMKEKHNKVASKNGIPLID